MPSYPPELACTLKQIADKQFACECGVLTNNPNAKIGPCAAKRARAAGERFEPVEVTPRPTVEERIQAHGEEVAQVWGRMRQAASLVKELGRWLMHGCPIRPAEERDRLAAICRACPRVRVMSSGAIRCSICGCGTGSAEPPEHEEHALKLLIGTTHCPDNPARW